MSESFEREWRFYLDDMIGFAEHEPTICGGEPVIRGARTIRPVFS